MAFCCMSSENDVENLKIVSLHRKHYKGNEKLMQIFPKYNTTSVPDCKTCSML